MRLVDQRRERDPCVLVPGIGSARATGVLRRGEDDEILILEFFKNGLPT